MEKNNESEKHVLERLANDVKILLSRFGTLSLRNGDYWVSGIDLSIPSADVLVFQKENFTPDLVAEASSLLDAYPENFRIRFIEAGTDGKPLDPLGGMSLYRYGWESF